MKAVKIDRITPADEVSLTEVPVPSVRPGWILIKVKAFGMNHSEKILRLGEIEADYITKPVIPGIECVGEVEDPSDTDLKKGDRIIAMMGGMGRSFDGSYAEYALLPAHHVFKVETDLPWDELASIPESYLTAWGSLFECLQLKKGETLLIRGATCALGYAAIDIAKALGCRIIGTTHRESKLGLLKGVDEAVLDNGELSEKRLIADKALDLIGPKSILDTLRTVKKGGIVCDTGILGGVFELNGFDPIKDIPNGVYLTGYFSNYPTQELVDSIFQFIRDHDLHPTYAQRFDFKEIRDACRALDEGRSNGKIVVVMQD
ncbi:MAG: zinc-binding dehydrogenase [Candidatus Methanomethylophilaceae archaeon]|nr:zinc-binding dehydrogenase [Candidatus Methanomethylophilaceae archaeon]